MVYHVRITPRSNRTHDEVKLDLSKEALISQFIEPYENGVPIIVGGKTIPPDDIERIRITETDRDSGQILPEVREEKMKSSVITFISDEWYVADKGKDVTDDLIKGPPGHKKARKKDKAKEIRKSNRVFIVHGHDQILKNELEVFLNNIGLEPIVLHRQPDEGLTIIEKLERFTDVGYSFVLLTPDDIGYSSEDLKEQEEDRNIEYRARQNVIFEFGYLLGKLGRDRVCCLFKEGTTLPTDVSGLLYKKVTTSLEDAGYVIIKELKAAGYEPKM